jgi:hypothetical protein
MAKNKDTASNSQREGKVMPASRDLPRIKFYLLSLAHSVGFLGTELYYTVHDLIHNLIHNLRVVRPSTPTP